MDHRMETNAKNSVSVIIPAYNAGVRLNETLDRLEKQRFDGKLEIVIVDSGSTDETLSICKDHGVKLLSIDHSRFSHSYARNLGAANAEGNILVFMTQDAMPDSRNWLKTLMQPVISERIAAVSCGEACPETTDIYYRIAVASHRRFLGIERNDRIGSWQEGMDSRTLRINASLNDITVVISRELFDRYQYRYDYAEDLDLGIRLLEDGYRIKLLSGVRTVHGHDRPAGYYFKRGFVEARSLKKILKENGAGQGDFSDAVQYLFDGCRAMDRIADLFKAPHQEDQVLREALQLTDSCRKKNGVFFSGAFRNLAKYFLRQYVPYLLYHKQKWSREDYRRYTLACMYKQHALLAGYSFGKIADAPEDLSKIENLCKGV